MPAGQALNIERHSLFRLHKIDQLIRQKRYPNVPALSRCLEVSTRTIERDLEFLRDRLGAPLSTISSGGATFTPTTVSACRA